MNNPELVVILVIAFLAGCASIMQSVKNSRTSTDKDTGVWFSIGVVLAVVSLLVLWLTEFN